MSEIKSLYLNGLGNGTLRKKEELLLDRQRKKGITVVSANINWRSAETFTELRDRIAEQTQGLLESMDELGKLVLNASSAGVCLALAVREKVDDSRVRVIGHSGRIRAGELSKWDPRTMDRCAHIGTDEESRSFYDGVLLCENEIIPRLSQDYKAKTILTTPFAGIDEIVPGSTMPIEGVRNVIVPAIGHVLAIGYGLYRMPTLLQKIS